MEKYGGNLPAPKAKPRLKAKPGRGLGAAAGRKIPVAKRAVAAPKSGALKPLATPKALASAKLPDTGLKGPGVKIKSRPGAGSGPLKDLEGIGRVVLHGTGALAESTYKHPVGAIEKTASSAGEIAKGVAGAAIALPVYAVKHPIKTLDGEGAAHIAERMITNQVKAYKAKYGPSFRGEKGAYRKLEKQVEKEGPLPTALDVATLVAPASSGLGKAAKLGSRERAALKVEPLTAAKAQHARPSAIGAAIDVSHDAARKAKQKAAVARSQKRLRTRLPGVKSHHIEGRKPTILNTEPKPLTARRANLKPGEVAPLSELAANRTLRKSVAEIHGNYQRVGAYRVARHVTGRKGSVRAAFKPLDEKLHPAAITAAQLGIKDAAGARAIIPARLKEIEQSRAAALARKGKTGKVDAAAEAHAAGAAAEEAQLRGWLKDPAVFDHPHVQAAAEKLRANPIGPREGLSPDRAAHGRADLVGGTLGVKTAAQRNAEAQAAHAAERARLKADVQAKRAEVIKQQQAVQTGRLLTREAAIGKGMGGKIRVSDPATLKAISRHEGKLAKRTPLNRIAGHGEGLVRHTRGLAVAKQELRQSREALKQSSAPPPRIQESAAQYAARVDQAAAERGLAPPAYTPSHFEKEGLVADHPSNGPENPLGKKRAGTLYRLGREDKTLDVVERSMSASLKRGAQKQAEGHILGKHGIPFASEQDLRDFAAGLGLNVDRNLGKVDVAIHSPMGSEAPKGMVTPRTTPKGKPVKGVDAGDYVKTDNVFLVPTAVKKELDALRLEAKTPASALQKLAHYPQAALLALSPSWFQFQRVNDMIAASIGGSLQHTVALEKLRRGLDADSREVLHMMAGGGISSELLTPFSARKLGRMQRVMDSPVYNKLIGSGSPATALLRADQAITHGFRERQLLHNLSIVARKMDPDVGAIAKAFGPIGHAFKTADVELATKLLKDPKYTAQLEDAAARLMKVHGDWHNYTARERSLKHYAAFYGFLRYATRMALYTLPVNHPYVGLLIAQLGAMGAADAKKIIGPDIPYGLSALYNDDGTVAADLTRANPLLGPLFSVTKPEQALGLMTPLAGITMNYLTGQPISLNDSAEGHVTQYTVKGDPTRHDVGGFGGEGRTRIAIDQLLGLLSPYREWKKFDGRQQSSDSLAWDRRYLKSTTVDPQLRINEKNAQAKKADGASGLVRDLFPLVSSGSPKNVKKQGQAIAAAKASAADAAALNAAKRDALNTPLGAARREIDLVRAQIKASQSDAKREIEKVRREIQLAKIRAGGRP